jgi:hypothetical protein
MAEVKFSEFPPEVTITASKVVGLNPGGENAQFDATVFKGDTGATGAQGVQGDKGDVGNTGPQGDQGIQGDKGDKGDIGLPGNDGNDGAAATADAGSTVTGVAGSNATVVNSGTTAAAIFDFTIPRGDTGAQGDAGTGYNLIGDASVAELDALTAAAIPTNDAWVMLDAGDVEPIGATQATAVVAGDLVVWSDSDYFVNYGQTSGAVVDSVFGRTGAVVADGGDYSAFYATTTQGALADTATQPGDLFIGAGTTGLVPDPSTEGGKFLQDDGQFVVPPVSPVGGLTMSYTFSTTTTEADPGSGLLRVNNADQTLATELYVSATSKTGNDVDFVWANMYTDEFVGLWEQAGDHEGIYYIITGPPVDNTGWWTIPIQVISGVGGIDDATTISAFTIDNPNEKLPPDGADKLVLKKASATDYDTEWGLGYESGVSLPSPTGYPEGFLFCVTT